MCPYIPRTRQDIIDLCDADPLYLIIIGNILKPAIELMHAIFYITLFVIICWVFQLMPTNMIVEISSVSITVPPSSPYISTWIGLVAATKYKHEDCSLRRE